MQLVLDEAMIVVVLYFCCWKNVQKITERHLTSEEDSITRMEINRTQVQIIVFSL